MKRIEPVLLVLLLSLSCSESATDAVQKQPKKEKAPKVVLELVPEVDKGPEEFMGLIDVQSINHQIFADLRYASDRNFMGFKMYQSIQRPYMQPEVAERLSRCQDYLSEIDSSLHLLIYDAARPVSVQKLMWDALDTLPISLRGRYVSNPKYRSLHNLGAAVDITICNADLEPLDMGAGFDEFAEIAYPRMEWHFLQTGELSKEQHANRMLLRKVMEREGFRQLSTEWWHFNAYSRAEACSKFTALQEEPVLD